MQRWVGLGVLANDLLVLAAPGHERPEAAGAWRAREMDGLKTERQNREVSLPPEPSIPHFCSMSVFISAPESS